MTNQEIASILDQMADLLQIVGANRFRFIAFQNAAEAIRSHSREVSEVASEGDLTEIKGIGKGIAESIHELLETGTFADFEKLQEEVPEGVRDMLQIPDVGPKTAARLWNELDLTSIEAVKEAAEAQQIRALKGFGAKSEEKLLKGIELMAKRGDGRTPIGEVRPIAMRMIVDLLASLPDHTIEKIEVAGSLRRWRETIGDVDILVVSQQPADVMEAFRSLPQVDDVAGSGKTKTSVILGSGLQVDLRVVEGKHWGAALQYFSGSQAHNVSVRGVALSQGWSLNEYGLTATGKGEVSEGESRFFESEEALYNFVGMQWVPPEMREDRGEVKLAQQGKLPQLIQLEDIRGELHGHSTWSDGKGTIEQMAEVAMARGYQYWNVSDHSAGLGVASGLDADQIAKQAEEIAILNQQFSDAGLDFRLLRGTEAEVLADGSMGLPDEVLAELDVVVASIHSALRQDRETITERCLKVVRNPHVDILGHATGRLLGRRPPSEIDMEQVLRACAESKTVVEINAHPSRLDVNEIYARRAVDLGCKIAINSDAHSLDGPDMMDYGIALARRAWLRPEDVVNTWSLDELNAFFNLS